MRKSLLAFCFFIALAGAVAQKRQQTFLPSHPIAPAVQAELLRSDTLRILAVLVEFQQDQDVQTTGTGKFQLATNVTGLTDPPPHDSLYFVNKLRFAQNYFRKVSNNQLTVKGDIIGHVTLAKVMSAYSPLGSNGSNKSLASLCVDSWKTADSVFPNAQFSKYDAFVIFHAGVGRDIDLVNLLGYDPFPYDLPSLYFNLGSFQSALQDPSFTGIQVKGGTFKITNTIVLPETETRVISTSQGDDTLKLAMNGLLVSSVGSRLGLPDLFNTKTGKTGIGQFGLMDGPSIFAYGGIFPPEPSAWEKVFLGWVTPVVVNTTQQNVFAPAVGLPPSTGEQDTIYKIPITDREYFLVENRNRDPQNNGQRLTVVVSGVTKTLSFATDTTGFSYYDISAVTGSVIDVEDFDWALIGRTDGTGRFDGGGILIWHIDENVIQQNLAANAVNADPAHRGVNLEEADGSQDIGQTYDITDPGSGTESGSPLDCWFDGNVSVKYTNAFDQNSFPSSNSYSGAKSLVMIKGFGARSPRMTFAVQIGDNVVQPITSFPRSLGAGKITYPAASSSGVYAAAGGKVFAFQRNGSSRTQDPTGLLSLKGGQFAVAVNELQPGNSLIVGAQDSSLYLWNVSDVNGDGVIDSVNAMTVNLGKRITVPAMFVDLAVTRSILVGGESGTVWQVSYAGAVQSARAVSGSPVTSLAQLPLLSLTKPAEYFFACGGRLYGEQTSVSLPDSSLPWMLTTGVSVGGNFVVAAQCGGGRVVAFDRLLSRKLFDNNLGGPISSLAIADVDGDGNKDIVLSVAEKIYALNQQGFLLDGFPVRLIAPNRFVGGVLVGDVNGDGAPEIIALSSDGVLRTYRGNAAAIPGLTFQAVSSDTVFPLLFQAADGNIGAFVVTSAGAVETREISSPFDVSRMVWTQYLGNSAHANADVSTPVIRPPSADFFPKTRIYNYPNPVYGSSTQIRYYVSTDASVAVKIFDLGGAKITELSGNGVAGDNEITWDVTGIQSGVYLARVEATGSGKSDVAIIKIAVVK